MLKVASSQQAMLRSVGQHTSAWETVTMAVATARSQLETERSQHAALLGLSGLVLFAWRRAALSVWCMQSHTHDCCLQGHPAV